MPESEEARTEQLALMLTKAEKSTVKIFARQMGMSMSTAGRHLLIEGMKTTPIPLPDTEAVQGE